LTTLDHLDTWRQSGAISDEQHALLASIVRKSLVSVHLELNALLYAGVLLVAGGIGWTVHDHFNQLGDMVVVLSVGALCLGCVGYCLRTAKPYSHLRVEPPNFVFDYILYLGCLALAVELSYVEFRFHLLKDQWDAYLLASAVVYLVMAYRFDNRLVLSLALSTFAGWFGVRWSTVFGFLTDTPLRVNALLYAEFIAGTGSWTHQRRWKSHFLDAYLHVAANTAMVACVWGVFDTQSLRWLLPLLVMSALSIAGGIRWKHFAFVGYGAVYGYIGFSAKLLQHVHDEKAVFTYFAVSAALAVGALVAVSRRYWTESS